MAKSRASSKRPSERKEKPTQGHPDRLPLPPHLPDPPRKNPWFLGLAVALLISWLLALLAMALFT